MIDSIEQLSKRVKKFAEDRHWIQFHNPKNLVMALTVEAGELMEIYQWKTTDESKILHDDPKQLTNIMGEISDIFIYLTHLVNILDIDLLEAVNMKMDLNDIRFPPFRQVNSNSA